ncbi:GAF domain-containing protein [Fontimonas thermophila]|uniref:GAF domain-containing protein n=2 Tax=Fontimonas thermophila TaxID=1076937 RepID=A0A1I2IC29_9GAMM|nr:GAF domain-containing protein [Fontimonas thermophila]
MFNHRMPVAPRGVVSFPDGGQRRRRAHAQASRRAITWTDAGGSEPAREVLRNTLQSACDLIGAERGFILRSREDAALEVAYAHRIAPRPLLDTVLGPAARVLHRAMVGNAIGMSDRSGAILPCPDPGAAIVALPLDLGVQQCGVLCLLRSGSLRPLSALDLDILGALAEQAALALRAAQQESALSQLAARLNGLAPQLA